LHNIRLVVVRYLSSRPLRELKLHGQPSLTYTVCMYVRFWDGEIRRGRGKRKKDKSIKENEWTIKYSFIESEGSNM
jgi:hypothetical protein